MRMMVRLAFLSIVVLLLGNLQASGHGEPEWIGTVEIGGVKWQYAKIEFEDGVYQVQPSKKKIAKNAWEYDPSIKGTITIPSVIEGVPVVALAADAFRKCETLEAVIIPSSIKTIMLGAFYACGGLKSVTIQTSGSEGLKKIKRNVFEDCKALQSIELPSTVEEICGEAFSKSGLKSLTIPGSVKVPGYEPGQFSSRAVAICNGCAALTTIVFKEGVEKIGGDSYFVGCDNLVAMHIPESLKEIQEYSIDKAPQSIYYYGNSPDGVSFNFGHCSEATLYVPKGTKAKFANVKWPDAFKSVEEMATGVELSYDNAVVKVKDYANGSTVAVGVSLQITLVGDDKVFDELRVNGGDPIVAAQGLEMWQYEVTKDDEAKGKVEISCTAKEGIKLVLDGADAQLEGMAGRHFVKVGEQVTIVVADVKSVFQELKVNGKPQPEAMYMQRYSYTVTGEDEKAKVVKIEGKCVQGIKLSFNDLIVAVKVGNQVMKSPSRVAEGCRLAIVPKDANTVFSELKVNGQPLESAIGEASYDYTVLKADQEVKIESASTAPAALEYDESVVKINGHEHGDRVKKNEVLTIAPVAASGVFEELTVNGVKVEDAKGKREVVYSLTVADVVKKTLRIVASVKPAGDPQSAVESALLAAAWVEGNPIGDALVLRGVEAAERVTVYSLRGERVYFSALRGQERLAIDARGWARGVYLVRIWAADGSRSLQIVKR